MKQTNNKVMQNLKGQSILSANQFNRDLIDQVIQVADQMNKEHTSSLLKGKIMASLFFEPSTRTRLSFESAMHRLGGDVITVSKAESSSLNKGESLEDTAKTIAQYADIIAVRHSEKGSANVFSQNSIIPIINAGDGGGEHPTQALIDIYTIWSEKGKIDGLTITLAGDLKYGRTIHSLVKMLSNYNVKIILYSPGELNMPEDIVADIGDKLDITLAGSLQEAIKESDVFYNTRVQQERFSSKEEYEKCKDSCIINKNIIQENNPHITIMHPLPRLNEISKDVDELEGAAYFRQAGNGVKVRMALLSMILI